MNKSVIITVLILAILTILSFFFILRFRNQPQNPTPSIEPVVNIEPSPSVSSIVASDSAELTQGGSSYLDPKGVYSLLYPNDYRIDTQNNGQQTRIYKRGPTQQGQTEMYDGVIMVFESVELGGKTPEQWVDESIKSSTQDGTSEVIEPKKKTTVNNYSGFSYKLRGLGESQYYIIQKDTRSPNALVITIAVNDPTNAGFQSQVDSVLASIQLLK